MTAMLSALLSGYPTRLPHHPPHFYSFSVCVRSSPSYLMLLHCLLSSGWVHSPVECLASYLSSASHNTSGKHDTVYQWACSVTDLYRLSPRLSSTHSFSSSSRIG